MHVRPGYRLLILALVLVILMTAVVACGDNPNTPTPPMQPTSPTLPPSPLASPTVAAAAALPTDTTTPCG